MQSMQRGRDAEIDRLAVPQQLAEAQPDQWAPGTDIVINGVIYIVQRRVGGGLTGQVYKVGFAKKPGRNAARI